MFINNPIIEGTAAEAYVRKEKQREAHKKAKSQTALDGSGDETEKEVTSEEKEDLSFDDPFVATGEVGKTKAAVSLRKETRTKKHAEKMKAKEEPSPTAQSSSCL